MPHPTIKAMLVTALLQAPLMLGACTNTPQRPAASGAAHATTTTLNSEQHLIFADLMLWLSDSPLAIEAPDHPNNQAANQTVMVGPQLAAGDWLAFQCAIAGGYWDTPAQPHAPKYAKAPAHATLAD